MNDTSSGPRILDVPVDWVLPKLGKRVVPAGAQLEATTSEDSVTSYDTATGDLAEQGVTLTRGSGADASWVLAVAGTINLFPVAGRGVPAEVRDLLLGVRAGAALTVSGRASVTRTLHRVLDAEGVELGSIADVHTQRAQTAASGAAGEAATVSEGRHLEVSGWDGPFVDAVVARLTKADAVVRTSAGSATNGGTDTVGDAVREFLREQRSALLLADLDLRRGEDTVHPFRVAIRRIRSALRVVGVAEPEAYTALDAELRWLSGTLGAVRDMQVLREHLRASIDTLGARNDLDLAGTDALLHDALDSDETAARAALATAMSGRRYLSLLRTLRDWTAIPPFTAAADEPEKRLSRYVRAAAKDLDRKLTKAGGSAERLHRARKAAKRARYVASFAGASAGKHGPHVAQRAKSLQSALGDHQDCVVAADYVARVAATAVGEPAFGCGVLWVHEQERANEALRRAQQAENS